MSFFDALFGRSRLKKPDLDPLFALSTHLPDLLSAGVGLGPAAALCLKEVESITFQQAQEEAAGVLQLYAKEHAMTVEQTRDRDGFLWFKANAAQPDDAVLALHAAGQTFTERGFGGELLAAVFSLIEDGHQGAYLIYNYKRSRFYPFVPENGHQRDNGRELKLQSLLEHHLALEPELERWYALWDMPI